MGGFAAEGHLEGNKEIQDATRRKKWVQFSQRLLHHFYNPGFWGGLRTSSIVRNHLGTREV